MVSERDKSTNGPTSPYDEPTGQIDLPRTPQPGRVAPPPNRDDFYERHARRSPAQVSRVDDLDDLDPGDVETRPTPSAPNTAPQTGSPQTGSPQTGSPQTGSPQTGSPQTGSPQTGSPQTDPLPVDRGVPDEQTAVIERPPVVARPDAAPARAEPTRVTAGDEPGGPDRNASRITDPVGVRRRTPDSTPEPDTSPTEAFAARRPAADAEATANETRPLVSESDAEPPASDATADDLDEAKAKARRGTLDLGLLLLRVAVGAVALAHGLQKLFGWWSGPGLSGFEDMLVNSANSSIGFNPDFAKPLAILGALSETLGGAMVILGLLTPVGASAILGTMLIAAAYKTTLAGGFSFFAAVGGVEYELTLAVAAAVIILTGPGLYSLDFPYGWARRPFIGSFLWLIVGIGAAALIWILCNGTNPLSSPGNPGG
ncbi:DoxX family membrane protein [Gordonia sp. NPDC003585]|uniref:DoxX family protein n=1 Tax=Gordonia sp. NPDC003585 TaxID=3154275 RepID=UPI0033A836A1